MPFSQRWVKTTSGSCVTPIVRARPSNAVRCRPCGSWLASSGFLWPPIIIRTALQPSGARSGKMLANQDPQGLQRTAMEGLAQTMGVTQEPDVVFTHRWEKGIPHYVVGHLARVEAIFERSRRQAGLHLVCNAYRGIAMNDCVRNGRELAGQIAGAN